MAGPGAGRVARGMRAGNRGGAGMFDRPDCRASTGGQARQRRTARARRPHRVTPTSAARTDTKMLPSRDASQRG